MKKTKTPKKTLEVAKPSQSSERRNLPRLILTTEQFRLNQNGKLFPMGDLSKKGMGFLLTEPEDRLLFIVGHSIEGILNLLRQRYPVKAKVRSVSADRVGCEFESPSADLIKAIDAVMDPKRLGESLKPMPAGVTGMLWYHGAMGTDLFFTRSVDGQYSSFTLYVFRDFVQWDREKDLQTGSTHGVSGANPSEGALRHQTLELKPDDAADPKKLDIAKTLILSSKLPLELQKWCIRHLK